MEVIEKGITIMKRAEPRESLSESRDLIIVMTYIVVVFSILVQGLTMKPLIQNAIKGN